MVCVIKKGINMKEMKIDKERGVVEEKRFDYRGFPCVILFMDMLEYQKL